MNETEFDAVYALLNLSHPLAQGHNLERPNLNIRVQIRILIKDFVRGFLCFRQLGSEALYEEIAFKIDEALYFNANGDFMVYANPETLKLRAFELISYLIRNMYFYK